CVFENFELNCVLQSQPVFVAVHGYLSPRIRPQLLRCASSRLLKNEVNLIESEDSTLNSYVATTLINIKNATEPLGVEPYPFTRRGHTLQNTCTVTLPCTCLPQLRARVLTAFWWRMTGSNRRPPACKAGALPAELIPRCSAKKPWWVK